MYDDDDDNDADAGWMAPGEHTAYLAAIKPLTDLYNTEHDAWQSGQYVPDAAWTAAQALVKKNLAELYA